MIRRTVSEACAAMAGAVVAGSPATPFWGAALDSREVRGGELFFALAGERTDGHRFVAGAFERGAAAAVVARPLPAAQAAQAGAAPADAVAPPEAARAGGRAEPAVVQVADTQVALHDLTRAVRRTVPRRALVGVTGSAGKTTTKEFLVALMQGRFRVSGSPGNRNSLLGFPLALLALDADCDWMVAEMAMSTPGELAQLSKLARPDVALFTNVRPVHLESFDRPGEPAPLRAIAEAKAGLLAGHAPGGLIVANAADPEVRWLVTRHTEQGDPRADVRWYAVAEEGAATGEAALDLVARELSPAPLGGTTFTLEAPQSGERVRVWLPVHGAVNVANFLAAAACAHALGVPLAAMPAVARAATAQPGRGRLLELESGARVIDDSYNANPDATRAALLAAHALPAARRWCVLGDMRELGLRSLEHHRAIGRLAAELGFAPIVGVGEQARTLVAAAAPAETVWFATAEEASLYLPRLIRPGDLVLIKGSRGVGLDRLVAALAGTPQSGAGERATGGESH